MEKSFLLKLFITCFALPFILQSCSDGAAEQTLHAPALLSDVRNKASCVFLTQDEQGNPAVSWVERDGMGNKYFYFSYWNAGSQSFAPQIAIPIEQHASLHEEGMPKIAIRGDGVIFATYETNVPSEKSRFGISDIRYVVSFDKGTTWTAPKSIQEPQETGSRSFSNMIRLGDGEIGIAWLDSDTAGTPKGRPVRFAKTDGDASFGKSVLVDSFACECCRTTLSSDDEGNIMIAFRDLLAGSIRDISISSSSDNGRTFGAAIPFSGDHWKIDGCPHNGPSIAHSNGKIYVTWFTGAQNNGVLYAELDGNGNVHTKRRLNPNGRFAQLCAMPDGTRIVVYDVPYRQGDSMYSKIKVSRIDGKEFFEKEISLPNAQASYPVVQAAGEQHVVIAWTDSEKVYYIQQHTAAIDDVISDEPSRLLSSYPAPICGI